MAALITTSGGSTTDSYATLVEIRTIANQFKKIPFYATVVLNIDAQEDETLNEVARIATQNIDGFNPMGVPVTTSQLRAWPRTGPALNLSYRDTIPNEVKQAQVLEMAGLLSSVATINNEAADDISAGIQSKSMGNRSVTYKGRGSENKTRTVISNLAKDLLDRARLLSYSVNMPRS